MPFGYAERMYPKTEELVVCDPLAASNWQTLARTQIWKPDPDGVIEVTRRGLAVVDSDTLVAELAKGLILKGQNEEAQAELDTRIKSVEDAESLLVAIAAALGDREQAATLFEDIVVHNDENRWQHACDVCLDRRPRKCQPAGRRIRSASVWSHCIVHFRAGLRMRRPLGPVSNPGLCSENRGIRPALATAVADDIPVQGLVSW